MGRALIAHVASIAVAATLGVLSRAGVNLSGLIATSAVFTAMLGFSLQDVIGNIAGGAGRLASLSATLGAAVNAGDVLRNCLVVGNEGLDNTTTYRGGGAVMSPIAHRPATLVRHRPSVLI